ncbi:MAG TPA: response regulator [Thermoanaerobaculia bacterium]|nr:response regulator [Thermoanaerobaculia bacterium]
MIRLLRPASRILLLDDDPSIQRLVSTLLKRDGHRVDVVSSGSQALEKLNAHQYDALVLDIMTPTEGGMTVIRELREAAPALLKKIILLTASPESILRPIESDVYAIVRKPFQPADLLDTIHKLMA